MARNINGFVGTYSSIAELSTKFPPSEYMGCSANVGVVPPYSKYWCDGINWSGLNATDSLVTKALSLGSSAQRGTLKPGFPMMAFPSSSADWGVVGWQSTAGTIAATTRDGIRVVRITTLAGEYGIMQTVPLTTPRVVPLGRVHILMYVHDPSKLSNVICYMGDGVPLTNSYTCGIDMGSTSFPDNGSRGSWPGWYVATIDPNAEGAYASMTNDTNQSRWAVNTGTPTHTGTAMSTFQFLILPRSGQVAVVDIAGVWVEEMNPKPAIVFTSDDTEASWYTGALPILEKYGMRGTHCAIGDNFDKAGYMTTSQAKDAVARGHEFITHGITSGPLFDYRDFSTKEQVYQDIMKNKNILLSKGLIRNGGENLFAYPSGAYQLNRSSTYIQEGLDMAGITYARVAALNSSGLLLNKYTKLQKRYMPVMAHAFTSAGAEPTNIATIILRIQEAVANGRSCILMNHQYVTTAATGVQIGLANFEAIVAAVANLCTSGSARNLLFSELCLEADAA